MKKDFEQTLRKHLDRFVLDHKIKESMSYSLFPPGKAFRPKLIYALATDVDFAHADLDLLASAIESHHVYTLIHDDLPSMDNDDIRRGKKSSHIRFNEAKAILTGDALLNFSYQLIAHMESEQKADILKLITELCGANGLIHGQDLDLNSTIEQLEDILLIHKLKTSNLFIASLQSCNLLSHSTLPQEKIYLLGNSLGVLFQLIDDLTEIGPETSAREKQINPFYLFSAKEVITVLEAKFQVLKSTLNELKLEETKKVINSYLKIMNSKIKTNESEIKRVCSLDIPRMLL